MSGHKEFTHRLWEYAESMRAIARKLAKTDDELFEDLCQIGRIALWKLRLNNVRNPSAYIRQAMKFQMIDYLRSQGARRHLPLTELLRSGYTIFEDADGPFLMRPGTNPGQRRNYAT